MEKAPYPPNWLIALLIIPNTLYIFPLRLVPDNQSLSISEFHSLVNHLEPYPILRTHLNDRKGFRKNQDSHFYQVSPGKRC